MLLALYLLEAGLLLILAPWSRFWDRNYFVALAPGLTAWLSLAWVKGAVTGIGIVSVAAAFIEVSEVISRWRFRRGSDR